MKSTGVIRKVDELGRIVLPVELRNTLNINSGNFLEIFVNEDLIILKKYSLSCFVCDCSDTNELIHFTRKDDESAKYKSEVCICNDCLKEYIVES